MSTKRGSVSQLSLQPRTVARHVLPAMHKGHCACHRSFHVAVINKIQHTADRAHRPIHRVAPPWTRRAMNNGASEARASQPASSRVRHAARNELSDSFRDSRDVATRCSLSAVLPSLTSRQFLYLSPRHYFYLRTSAIDSCVAPGGPSRDGGHVNARHTPRYTNTRLVRGTENDRKTTERLPNTRYVADVGHVTCRRSARYTCTFVSYVRLMEYCPPYRADTSFQLFVFFFVSKASRCFFLRLHSKQCQIRFIF